MDPFAFKRKEKKVVQNDNFNPHQLILYGIGTLIVAVIVFFIWHYLLWGLALVGGYQVLKLYNSGR